MSYGKQWKMTQVLVGRPKWSSWKMTQVLGPLQFLWQNQMEFLASAWPIPDCSVHLGSEPADTRSLSVILALRNKRNNNKTGRTRKYVAASKVYGRWMLWKKCCDELKSFCIIINSSSNSMYYYPFLFVSSWRSKERERQKLHLLICFPKVCSWECNPGCQTTNHLSHHCWLPGYSETGNWKAGAGHWIQVL